MLRKMMGLGIFRFKIASLYCWNIYILDSKDKGTNFEIIGNFKSVSRLKKVVVFIKREKNS